MSTCSCVFVCVLNDDWCLRTERERERERGGCAGAARIASCVFVAAVCFLLHHLF